MRRKIDIDLDEGAVITERELHELVLEIDVAENIEVVDFARQMRNSYAERFLKRSYRLWLKSWLRDKRHQA